MKLLWCWRCQMEIPMLDEQEFTAISQASSTAPNRLKLRKLRAELPPDQVPPELLDLVCTEYFRLTGFRETNENAVFHHRISLYGPLCSACGKPLRTPRASFCAECGHHREVPSHS